MVNNVGTFNDFKHFAKDKVGVNELHAVQNFVYPSIIEERDSAVRMTEMSVFSAMIRHRIVFLSGEVDSNTMDTIVAQLLYLDSIDNVDINLYINSPGGSCYSGLELVSVMDFINSDVSTTILGLAASMGAVIASSGVKGKRNVLPYSRFMIHQPSQNTGYSKYTDSKIALEEMESVKNDIYEILSKNSGKPIEEVERLCNYGDKWIKGKDIVNDGWADNLILKKEK